MPDLSPRAEGEMGLGRAVGGCLAGGGILAVPPLRAFRPNRGEAAGASTPRAASPRLRHAPDTTQHLRHPEGSLRRLGLAAAATGRCSAEKSLLPITPQRGSNGAAVTLEHAPTSLPCEKVG